MARINDKQAEILARVSDEERVRILYKYLAQGKKQAIIAQEVYDDYDDWASENISLVTRAFGFHNQAGKGKYRQVPEDAFWDFVEEFSPEGYHGGLDAGTFDRWLKEWYQRQNDQSDDDEDYGYETEEPVYIPTPNPRPCFAPPHSPANASCRRWRNT